MHNAEGNLISLMNTLKLGKKGGDLLLLFLLITYDIIICIKKRKFIY